MIILILLFLNSNVSAIQHNFKNYTKRDEFNRLKSLNYFPHTDLFRLNNHAKDKRDLFPINHSSKQHDVRKKEPEHYFTNEVRQNYARIPSVKYSSQRRSNGYPLRPNNLLLQKYRKNSNEAAAVPRYNNWRDKTIRSQLSLHQSDRNHPDPLPLMLRNKKSTNSKFGASYNLNPIELFFIFVSLITLLSIVLTVVHILWNRKGQLKSSMATSESTLASSLMGEDRYTSIDPPASKSEAEVCRQLFVTNDFDGEGDNSARRMKLERWMYQDQRYVPRMMAQKQGPRKCVHKQNFMSTASSSEMDSPSQRSSLPRSKAEQRRFLPTEFGGIKRSELEDSNPRTNMSFHKNCLSGNIAQVKRSESEVVGRSNITNANLDVAKKISSMCPVPMQPLGIKSQWDKSNGESSTSIPRDKAIKNQVRNASLISFNSHYIAADRNPAQRYSYTMKGNMDVSNRDSEPFRVNS